MKRNKAKDAYGEYDDSIAIVGMSCRFPGAHDYNSFWNNLINGNNSIIEVPSLKWNAESLFSEDVSQLGKMITKWGGFIEEIDEFDNTFFNITVQEAKKLDPQQRILLEEAWLCIEDSGINIKTLQEHITDVFVGVLFCDYRQLCGESMFEIDQFVIAGNCNSLIPNRVSYFLNLSGKSLAIDTACSSATVAIHEAIHSLVMREANYALVAGVNVFAHPWRLISLSKARMLSPDGQCKTFDKNANGYAPSEGAGVLLLQPLQKAIADNNHIYAVIKGSAVNHCGHGPHVTSPSIKAQKQVIVDAFNKAKLSMSQVNYIEAHGTGTSLGDPIEIEALNEAFACFPEKEDNCYVGSVKANIGHLESAAGIAGIIKVVLVMRNREIPPSINITEINPLLNMNNSPLKINLKKIDLGHLEKITAGVSSFGFGGVNSHIVLESYELKNSKKHQLISGTNGEESIELPFLLSAKSEQSLTALIHKWKSYANSDDFRDNSFSDIIMTLISGRETFAYKCGGFVKSKNDIVELLNQHNISISKKKNQGYALLINSLGGCGFDIDILDDVYVLEKYNEITAIVEQQTGISGVSSYGATLQEFIQLCAMVNVLLSFGFSPDIIAGKSTGFYVSLVYSGAIALEDMISHICQNRIESSYNQLVHSIPYLDPATLEQVVPSVFSEQYLAYLIENAWLDRKTCATFINKARILFESQHTFKNNLLQWNTKNGQRHFDIADLLYNHPLVESKNDDKDNTFIILLLAIFSSLKKLYSKWGLAGDIPDNGDPFYELVDLLVDDVMAIDEILMVLGEGNSHYKIIIPSLNKRIKKMKADYAILYSYFFKNTVDSDWLEARFSSDSDFSNLAEKYRIIEVGGLPGLQVVSESTKNDNNKFGENFYNTLMKLWHEGYNIDWKKLYKNIDYQKVQLPSYSFIRNKFWLDNAPNFQGSSINIIANKNEHNSNMDKNTIKETAMQSQTFYYKPHWECISHNENGLSPVNQADLVLVFMDRSSLGESLKLSLQERGVSPISIFASELFRKIDKTTYLCNLKNEHDYTTLFNEIMRDEKSHANNKTMLIYYLVPFGEQSPIDYSLTNIEEVLAKGGESLFLLAKVLNRTFSNISCHMTVVTKNAAIIHENDKAEGYMFGGISGLLNVIPVENNNIRTLSIDFDEHIDMKSIAAFLVDSGKNMHTVSKHFGYRNRELYQKAIKPLEMTKTKNGGDNFRDNGIYLVIGGLGKLGYEITKLIASQSQATIIIVGRSALDDVKKKQLEQLNNMGAEILYFSADVGNYAHMKYVLNYITSEFKTINGIIHCGGIVKPRLILQKSLEDYREVHKSKCHGLVILDQLLHDINLDFFVIFSSFSSLFGLAGLSDYSAANGFIDSFVSYRNAKKKTEKTIAINWTIWENGGMGNDAHTVKHLESKGVILLKKDAGLQAFDVIFSHNEKQVIVLADPLENVLESYSGQLKRDEIYSGIKNGENNNEYVIVQNIKPYEHEKKQSKKIAVIGMSCRFPESPNINEFWNNLIAGKECIKFFNDDELRESGIPEELITSPDYIKAMPCLDDIEYFDAAFFAYSAKEAEFMDPQQRLLLENAWLALEDAGYPPSKEIASTGVFVSVMQSFYLSYIQKNLNNQITPSEEFAIFLSNDRDSAATRIAFKLNLQGPAVNVGTACSSSLVAIHMACKSLQNKECEMAVCGGASIMLPAKSGYLYQEGFLSSKDGHCRPFDESASGTVFGNGVGVVVLKPLDKAIVAGDHIYSVIIGSAINNDGSDKADFAAPSYTGQFNVIESAIEESGINPEAISYIEAHGTGTHLGDPLEFSVLNNIFKRYTDKKQFCRIGSIKSNIGHLNIAAGIAGLIKTSLCLTNKKIAPTINFNKPNSYIDFDNSPFMINTELVDWDVPFQRRAGISSFGIGGTNAHVIVEEAPENNHPDSTSANRYYLFFLSAKSKNSLLHMSRNFENWLAHNKSLNVGDICYTMHVGRKHFKHRLAVVANSINDLLQSLVLYNNDEKNNFILDNLDVSSENNVKMDANNVSALLSELQNFSASDELHVKKLIDVANYYIKGGMFEWKDMNNDRKYFRLSVPAYHFERKKYWFMPSIKSDSKINSISLSQSEPLGFILCNGESIIDDIVLKKYIEEELGYVLHCNKNEIDPDVELVEYGLDSIGIIQFNNRLDSSLGVRLSNTEMINNRTVSKIVRLLTEKLKITPVKHSIVEKKQDDACVNGRKDIYPLTFEQERYWDMEQLSEVNASLIIPFGLKVTGQFDCNLFVNCIEKIVTRHESMRTVYRLIDNAPMQVVLPGVAVNIPIHDLTHVSADALESEIQKYVDKNLKTRFNIEEQPLFRIEILKLAVNEYYLVFNIHHLNFDAISSVLFIHEFATLYQSSCNENEQLLAPVKNSFGQHAVKERNFFTKEVVENRSEFWHRHISGYKFGLDLPYDYVGDTRDVAPITKKLDREFSERVIKFASKHKISPYAIYLTGLAVLLYGYTENERIAISTTIANRNSIESETIIGLFASLLLIPIDLSGDPTFAELMNRVNLTIIEAHDNLLSYQELVSIMQREREDSNNPPVQVLFNFFSNSVASSIKIPGLELENKDIVRAGLSFDLFFSIMNFDKSDSVRTEYASHLFKEETAKDMTNNYITILDYITTNFQSNLGSIFDSIVKNRISRVCIASTFTSEPIIGAINFWKKKLGLSLKTEFAPFNQIFQELYNQNSLLMSNNKGQNIIMLRFEDWINNKDCGQDELHAELLRNVSDFILTIKNAVGSTKITFVICICPDSPQMLRLKGWKSTIQEMEKLLVAELSNIKRILLIDDNNLKSIYAVADYYDAEQDELGHIPYTDAYFCALGTVIMRRFYNVNSPQYKVIVLDCDNTLWKGVVGEDGVDGIKIDAPRGALQRLVVEQKKMGVLICLCSKNSESDVVDVFNKRSDMILQLKDIVAMKVNWEPKSSNIRLLADELNLGIDSFIFIDDNPVEISEVEINCPGVLALQFPEKAEEIDMFLKHTWSFDRLEKTAEDAKRTEMYRQNIEREVFLKNSGSFNAFLAGLNLEINIDEMENEDISRVSQLTYRTNQFNATTIRRGEDEIRNLINNNGYHCLVVKVKDRFGDYGLVGIVLYQFEKKDCVVDTLLLSCRVLGKGVEHAMVKKLGAIAQANGLEQVRFTFIPSQKNRPIARFLDDYFSDVKEPFKQGFCYIVASDNALGIKLDNSCELMASTEDLKQEKKPLESMNSFREKSKIITNMWKDYSQIENVAAAVDKQNSNKVKIMKKKYTAPRSDLEKKLAEIWKKILQTDAICVEENFFNMGGSSLGVVQVISQIRKNFGVAISQETFIERPVIAEIAKFVEDNNS